MKMLFGDFGDRYDAIKIKHADRLPEYDDRPFLVRPGWYPLVEAMLDHVARDFPRTQFARIIAIGGWLRVDVVDRLFDPRDDLRLSKLLQGYVTQSMSVCEECGSHHGQHVDATAYGCGTAMNRTLCSDCVPIFAELAVTELARKKKKEATCDA